MSKITLFESFFRVLRQNFHRFVLFVAYSVLCLKFFGRNSRKTIAGDENRYIFASETTKTGQPVGVKTTKQQEIKTKKYTIMKTMNATPMTVARYESSATVVKVMKSVKKGLASMVKFLMFISPVYPQCTQAMK